MTDYAGIALSMMGRDRTVAEALNKLITAFQWLEAAAEIERLEMALLVDSRLRLRFRDAAGTPQEFMLPTTPAIRDAVRSSGSRSIRGLEG